MAQVGTAAFVLTLVASMGACTCGSGGSADADTSEDALDADHGDGGADAGHDAGGGDSADAGRDADGGDGGTDAGYDGDAPSQECGNGAVEGDEECDLGPEPPTACPYDGGSCLLCVSCVEVPGPARFCGDGVVEPEEDEHCDGPGPVEECGDLDLGVGNVTCTELCQLDTSACQAVPRVIDIAAAHLGGCAVLEDGSALCWGANTTIAGSTRRVAHSTAAFVSAGQNCGVREDQRVSCVNGETYQAGDWIDFHDGCGLLADGTIRCPSDRVLPPPYDDFIELRGRCGLRSTGEVACFDGEVSNQPEGLVLETFDHSSATCGVDSEDALHCWGDTLWDDLPGSPVASVFLDRSGGCVHRPDGTVACFGSRASLTAHADSLQFSTVGLTVTRGLCGILEGTSDLWCHRNTSLHPEPFMLVLPEDLSLNAHSACAVYGEDAAYACPFVREGALEMVVSLPVGGSLAQVAAGDGGICVIDEDGRMQCDTTSPQGLADRRFRSVATHGRATCGVQTDGTLFCFGPRAIEPPAGDDFVLVAGGRSLELCALREGGFVTCFGTTSYLGDYPEDGGWEDVSASLLHACALREGEVHCWGDGQLPGPAPVDDLVTISVSSMLTWGAACGIREGGQLVCWGEMAAPEPAEGETYEQISMLFGNVCGITTSGAVRCWRSNYETPTPWSADGIAQVAGGNTSLCLLSRDGVAMCDDFATTETRLERIAVGASFACGLDGEGAIHCFGANDASLSFQPPAGVFRDIGVGYFGCAIDEERHLQCWAAEEFGGPVLPPPGEHVSLDVWRGHGCAISVGGQVSCWAAHGLAPLVPPAMSGATEVTVGRGFACALTEGDGLLCWGAPPSYPDSFAPTTIDAGSDQLCGLVGDGRPQCWGYNATVPPPGRFESIAVGRRNGRHDFLCAIDAAGAVSCEGDTRLTAMSRR